MIVVNDRRFVPGNPMRTAEWVRVVALADGLKHRDDRHDRGRTHCGISWHGKLSASWSDPLVVVDCASCLATPGRAPRVRVAS